MNLKALLVKARLEEVRKGRIGGKIFSKSEKEALIRRGYARKKGGKAARFPLRAERGPFLRSRKWGARKGGVGKNGGFELTDAGRKKVKVVMTGGVFDILHLGHVYTLEKARRMGDALVVVVAHDSTVRRGKGRPPVHTAKQRAGMLEKLRCVDLALVGDARDKEAVVRRVRPDVIVFGYDQKADARLQARVRKIRGRLNEKVFKTSRIVADL